MILVAARCFWSFVLPVLEYCSPVWKFAAPCHLELLDCVGRKASRCCGSNVNCDQGHRREVAGLSVF